jgi:signal transduction histidine kinase
LADAVRAEETALRPLWQGAVQLVLDLPAALPAVAADEDHLREVVRNLLANAHEALPGGKGVITAAARALDLTAADCLAYYGRMQPGPHVAVTVRDTGSGLSAEALRRVFAEPFFSTKSRRRGLGLAVAYGIAAANRGGLRLTNDPTGGAVAEAVFPAASAGAAKDRVSGIGYRVPKGNDQ